MSHRDDLGPLARESSVTVRVAIYYRVSTPGQVKDGYSLADQKRTLPAYAEGRGWRIVAEYEDAGINASTLTRRPGITQLLEDAKRGLFDVILVVEDTRLSRGELADWETIKAVCDEQEISLATPQGIFYRPNNEDDDLTTDLRGAMSKAEKKKLRRRTRRGRIEATREHRLCHARPPYGGRFEREEGARKGSEKRLLWHGPDGELLKEAETVRFLFEASAYGIPGERRSGTDAIAAYLSDVMKIKGPLGGRWSGTQVRRILRDRAYIGEWSYGGLSFVDLDVCPPLIPEELFELANERMEFRLRHNRGRKAQTYPPGLLSSFLFCEECGFAMMHAATPYKTGAGETRYTRAYVCTGHTEPATRGLAEKCPNGRWKAETVEATIWREIAAVIREPALFDEIIEKGAAALPKVGAREVAAIRQQLDDFDRRIERIHRGFEDGVYSSEVAKKRLDAVGSERVEVEAHLGELQRRVDESVLWEADTRRLMDRWGRYQAIVASGTEGDRRGAIEDLVERIIIDREGNFFIYPKISEEPLTGRILRDNKRALARASDLPQLARLTGRLERSRRAA